MNKRVWWAFLLALPAVIAWWLWLRTPIPSDSELTSALPVKREAPVQADAAAAAEPPLPSKTPKEELFAAKSEEQKIELLRGMARLSNRPIEFFGLVVDQDGLPIPGVKVTVAVRVTKEPSLNVIGDMFDYSVITTDAQGRFALTNAIGALLWIESLEKPGYEPSKKGLKQAYWYWRSPEMTFKPSNQKPEVFQMWKKAGAERLTRKAATLGVRCDGTPSIFDVEAGQQGGRGDLRVTLVRNPQHIVYGQRNYEWTLTLEAVNGGIIASDHEQMYLAPTEGYQSKLVVHMSATDPNWTDEKALKLYARLRGGERYARIELKALVGSDRETTPLYLTSFVNPSGSRNLEFDPLQDVVPSARPQTPPPQP